MSEVGVLSDRYLHISEWLIKYNDSVMFLKDVYLGKIQYESRIVEGWMDTIAIYLARILKYDIPKNLPNETIPEAVVLAIKNIVDKDPFLRSSVKNIYKLLTTGRFTKALSKSDFDVLDKIAAVLSENSSQAFRRIWRHR